MIELVEIEPMPGRRVPIESLLTIGRLECDLTISSPQVSRHHATLAPAAGGAEIEDLGSRNGTFVNDQRVAGKQPLAAGDTLRIGETSWAIEGGAAGAPTEIESRGDVPAPVSGIREIPNAIAEPAPEPEPAPAPAAPAPAPPAPEPTPSSTPTPAPAPAAAGALALGEPAPPRASAARRIEATLICYAVVLLTAIAVAIYLITR